MTSGAYGARRPHSHYDVILIVTSFATELAAPTVTDVRTDVLPHLICIVKMFSVAGWLIVGIHVHSVLMAAPLIRLRNIFS